VFLAAAELGCVGSTLLEPISSHWKPDVKFSFKRGSESRGNLRLTADGGINDEVGGDAKMTSSRGQGARIVGVPLEPVAACVPEVNDARVAII
jgi:hypothetical protein